MPNRSRLTREDLQLLAKKRPKTYFGRFFSLSYYADSATGPKVACVVAKKNIRHAVDRNTIKRRVREVIRRLLPALPGGSYVIYAKKKTGEASFAEIKVYIEGILHHT